MSHLKHIRTYLPHILALAGALFALLFSPHIIYAANDYQPLTAIPGVTQDHNSLADYINALFFLSIIVGALLAVVKIAFGGFQYMMSGIVTDKAQAKKDITSALLGLGILLASVTVLYTINTDLVNLDILSGAKSISLTEADSTFKRTGVYAGTTINPDTASKEQLAAFIANCKREGLYYQVGYASQSSDKKIGLCSKYKGSGNASSTNGENIGGSGNQTSDCPVGQKPVPDWEHNTYQCVPI